MCGTTQAQNSCFFKHSTLNPFGFCCPPISMSSVSYFPPAQSHQGRRKSHRKIGFRKRCVMMAKHQKTRFYILGRCVSMLLCWHDHSISDQRWVSANFVIEIRDMVGDRAQFSSSSGSEPSFTGQDMAHTCFASSSERMIYIPKLSGSMSLICNCCLTYTSIHIPCVSRDCSLK